MKTFLICTSAVGFACIPKPVESAQKNIKPNLIIIHTDEHNFRTLGCYRETLSDDQAFVWGKDAFVETPHIDRLAKQGVLCTNFYATSPVSTPSRASMITGLYPIATGSHRNHMPLNDDVVTFAQILKEAGYATSYVGKWHLDGDDKPGIAPERKFGFDDNSYMINRGHWKTLGENEDGLIVLDEVHPSGYAIFNPDIADETSFTTDFLTNRTLEIIQRDKEKPFAIMLSIPDPHGPDQVRRPYSDMYTHMAFEEPRTMNMSGRELPGWKENKLDINATRRFFDGKISQYFGMVKCIDDNVGRILDYLEAEGLDQNTIVVFTSDHGDLMGEHGKINKGLPYEASAKVPFLLRYPGKVKPGKQIEKAYTLADFTPTILGLMGIDHAAYSFHGFDTSSDFISRKKKMKDDRIIYMTNAYSNWVAAVNNRYKLVLSPSDKPWLFDLKKDPDELINFYNDPKYQAVVRKFKAELLRQMILYKDPLQIEEIQQ